MRALLERSILSEPTDAWADARRVEAWAGEIRVNLIRLVGIVAFYCRHLIEFLMGGTVDANYHLQVTWLTLFWAAMAMALHLALVRRFFAPWLKFVTILGDAAFITTLCVIAGGPRSPLIMLLFLLIAMAPLRLSMRGIYLATACAVGGYLIVLANYAWRVVGYSKYYLPENAALRVPRKEEAVIVLALLVAGLLAGQSVRQARRIAMRSVEVERSSYPEN